MPKFPEPPPRHVLETIGAARHVLTRGTELWRVYARGGDFPRPWNRFRSFGPLATMRFDHHEEPAREQERSILYGASRIPIGVAEFFQQERTIDRVRDEPWLVGFALRDDVTLLSLCGSWPTRAGSSMALSSGRRDRARRWSRAVYDAYPDIGGLWYPSSMYANQPACALYERCADVLPASPFLHLPLTAPGLYAPLTAVAGEIDYRLI